jgi:hypothetical protein
LLNDIGWLVFGWVVFIGMTLAVLSRYSHPRKQHHAGVYMMDTQVDELVKSRFTDDLVKGPKFKAHESRVMRRTDRTPQ